jgi:hypothetical protein
MEEVERLKLELKWARIERALLVELIRTNTTIPIDSILEKNESGYNLHNYPNGNIPIIVHSIMSKKTYKLSSSSKKVQKTPKYKPIANIELAQPIIVDDTDQEVKEENICAHVRELTIEELTKLDGLIADIANNRFSKPFLDEIKKLFKFKKHTETIESAVKRLEEVLITKGTTGKRLKSTLLSVINPLTARILRCGEYYNLCMEPDYHSSMEIHVPPSNTPYASSYHLLQTYGLCLFDVLSILKRFFKPHNLVYVALPKSTDEDPYSYYSLSKVEMVDNELKRRNWNLESRLEGIADELSRKIVEYGTGLFRSVYRDIFGDNEYREDFKNKLSMVRCDMEQLVSNMQYVSNSKFRVELCRLIKSENTLVPTVVDKFNLQSDDVVQRNSLKQKVESDLQPLYRGLFDNLRERISL